VYEFGIIITAMIGIATVAVSYLQLRISNQSGEAQLALQKAISDAQIDLEKQKTQADKDKNDRAFQFEVARMLLEKERDITTKDVNQVYYLRDIVMSTLPADMSLKITRKMADNASNDRVRSAWNDGFVKVRLSVIPTSPAPSQTSVTTITTEYVLAQAPSLATTPNGEVRIADLLQAAQEFHITDSNNLVIFLAYVLQNTALFHELTENLNYSARGLMTTWPGRFDAAKAEACAHNPQKIANEVYNGHWGNRPGTDDGWNFRGRGYLQTTGRNRYEKSSKLVGTDLVANPDRLPESRIAAREAAAWFAQLSAPISVESVVRRLSGGIIGIAAVQAMYENLAAGTPQVTEGLTISTDTRNGDTTASNAR